MGEKGGGGVDSSKGVNKIGCGVVGGSSGGFKDEGGNSLLLSI